MALAKTSNRNYAVHVLVAPWLAIVGLSTCALGQSAGIVRIDGSSTVAPISMAAAELFQQQYPRTHVNVGISGTGGGFKKFLEENPSLRTDINDASRPIKKEEIERAKGLGIEFIEIPVAIDGIAVMVHPSNDFCDYLTVEELKRIWSPSSKITNWNEIRDGLPDKPLKLFGPDADSGTFDYFTEAIVGKSRACRSDYTASSSDNVLVQGVAGSGGALGYVGYSYYEANHEKLKLIGISIGTGQSVKPTLETIRAGTYKPLSRPVFMYVNKESLSRAEVKAFLTYFLDNAKKIVEHPYVNYVALSDEMYSLIRARVENGVTGSPLAGAAEGQELVEIYQKN